MSEIENDVRALNVLTDKAEKFTITNLNGDDVELTLYPLQLGRLAMISRCLLNLNLSFTENENAVQQMWSICSEKPRLVAEIISIATLKTKEDIETKLNDRIELLLWSPTMTPTAYTNLLYAIVFQSYFEDFMNAIRSVKMLQVSISPQTATERIAPMEGEASGGK